MIYFNHWTDKRETVEFELYELINTYPSDFLRYEVNSKFWEVETYPNANEKLTSTLEKLEWL